MRQVLLLLWPSLMLVSCGKPSPTDPGKDVPSQSRPQTSSPSQSQNQVAFPNQTDPTSSNFLKPDTKSPELSPPFVSPAPTTPEALRTILTHALQMNAGANRDKALADVAWNALSIDPHLAVEAFQHLPQNTPEKIRLIQHYAMQLAGQNVDEAIAWAATIGSEKEVAAANAHVALVVAESDPQRAANLLAGISESGISGREFEVLVVQVVQRWGARAPAEAADWVKAFPSGAAREAGLQVIVEKWLPRDPSAAFAWANTVQDEKVHKETLRIMEGILLQQPQSVREKWLEHADPSLQTQLNQQRNQAINDVRNNLPKTSSERSKP